MFKKLNYKTFNKSIEEFIDITNIDTDPAHQRPQIPDINKSKGIIGAILNGIDTGEIKLNKILSENEEFEVIDGSNRLRSIKQFYENGFSVSGLTFNDLSDDEKDIFLKYQLRFIVYIDLSPEQKAEQFLSTNTSTPVNFPEKMNSYGVIPLANLIREAVRDIPSTEDSFMHSLFECWQTPSGNISYSNLDFTNARLYMDDQMARITYLNNESEGLVPHGDDVIERMYQDHDKFSDDDIRLIGKKNKLVLDFLKKCAIQRGFYFKKGLTKGEFVCLYRLYFHLTKILDEKGKKLKINDYGKFYLAFREAFDKFVTTPTRVENIFLGVGKDGQVKEEKVNKLFVASLKNHDANTLGSMQGCTQTIVWLLEEFQVEDFIAALDKKRVFSYEEISTQLQRQGFKDWIDGKPLKREDTAGGHIKAHSKEGETDAKTNLKAISVYHNSKCGDRCAREYKADYLKSLEETV